MRRRDLILHWHVTHVRCASRVCMAVLAVWKYLGYNCTTWRPVATTARLPGQFLLMTVLSDVQTNTYTILGSNASGKGKVKVDMVLDHYRGKTKDKEGKQST